MDWSWANCAAETPTASRDWSAMLRQRAERESVALQWLSPNSTQRIARRPAIAILHGKNILNIKRLFKHFDVTHRLVRSILENDNLFWLQGIVLSTSTSSSPITTEGRYPRALIDSFHIWATLYWINKTIFSFNLITQAACFDDSNLLFILLYTLHGYSC